MGRFQGYICYICDSQCSDKVCKNSVFSGGSRGVSTPSLFQVETGSYSALTGLTQPAFPVGLQQLLSLDQRVGGAPWNSWQLNRKVSMVNLSRMRILLLYQIVDPALVFTMVDAPCMKCHTLIWGVVSGMKSDPPSKGHVSRDARNGVWEGSVPYSIPIDCRMDCIPRDLVCSTNGQFLGMRSAAPE